MEPTEVLDAFVTGAQKQMVGIGKNDLRVEFGFEIALRETLDGGLGANGHEYGSFDDTVGGMQEPGACAGDWTLGLNLEAKNRHEFLLSDGLTQTIYIAYTIKTGCMFDWDDHNLRKIRAHRISREEVEGEVRFVYYGESEVGRLLAMIVTERKGKIRVVTAYDLDAGQKRDYLTQRLQEN